MRKMTFLIGATTGYVLGARAGRDRYDQIANLAKRASANPTIAQAKDKVGDMGGEMRRGAGHKASELGEKAAEIGGKAAEKAPSWMPGSRTAAGEDDLQAAGHAASRSAPGSDGAQAR
ncbi:MAG: hypothetical protein ACT4PP_13870 [Sporichthyaceae bacterium]